MKKNIQLASLLFLLLPGFLQAQDPNSPKPVSSPPPTTAPATTPAQGTPPAAYSADQKQTQAADNQAEGNRYKDYIEQYRGIAMAEMERAGVPASITLAQGILESNAGQSELAKEANNHFGIKCSSGWTGKTYNKTDDEKDEKGNPKPSCFRKYAKAEESYFDHSEFLRDPKKYYRYGFLFGLEKQDYRGWARGLEAAGYATDPGYSDKLINLIEMNQLYQYDNPATPVTTPPGVEQADAKSRIGRVNDVKLVLTREGETIDDVARLFRLNPQKVADYNERRYTPGQRLKANTRVYIARKKSKWRGRATHHFIRDEQTMFDVSQQYGIRLSDLLERNGIDPGQEPASGERVRIKGRRKVDEVVRLRDTSAKPAKPATDKPNAAKPTKPATSDEELPEIIGGDNGQPAPAPPAKPATSTPGTAPSPVQPTPGTRPSTSGNTPPSTKPTDPNKPDPTPVVEPYPAPVQPPATTGQAVYHTVAKGDTLFSLQRKYGTPVAKIKSMNGMTSDAIKIGQKLRVQ